MTHHDQRAAAVILAAGLGTRMKSALPKTLNPVLGRPMVDHVAATAEAAGLDPVVVVVGPEMSAVADAVPGRRIAVQHERRGTRSEEHTSELQSRLHIVCRLLLEK